MNAYFAYFHAGVLQGQGGTAQRLAGEVRHHVGERVGTVADQQVDFWRGYAGGVGRRVLGDNAVSGRVRQIDVSD